MADTDVRPGQNEAESYKAKLLQPSKNDELSVPDEPELPVLPPVKDAGSPPMTVTEAPAGAVEPDSDKGAPTEGASGKAGTNVKTTGASDDSAASGRTAAATNDETASGGTAGHTPVPDATENLDSNLPGAELSDVEKQAISDSSTAELVAAATGDASAAAVNEEPAPANVITVQPDESSDVTKIESDISAVLPGPGSKAGMPVATASAAGTAADGADSSTVEVERDLPHAMSVLTASDAAAAGLANLESQLDAGKSFNCLDSSSSSRSGSSMSRGGSVMSRTETGNIIDLTSPTAARETLPETLLESAEDQQTGPAAAAAAGDTKPAGAGVAAAYGHLQQAPAAAGDAAAEPAAAALPSGDNRTSSGGGRVVDGGDVTNNSGDVAAAAVPEPAVGVEKEGDLIADAATGGGSGADDVLADSATADAAAVDDSSDQNPLAAAAAAVAKPVAAAITDLKDVLLGPDITIGHSHDDHSKE